MAVGSTPSSKIRRDHWVTRMAISYEVDTSGMVPMPIREMGTTALGKMWVLVESEDIPELTFVRCQRPRHAKLDYREPTIHDVMRCLVVTHEERRWIIASITGVMQHLGMDHLPFPRTGPAVPPHP
ncbi:unnamed protein product [Lactuca saligna]|uniref:Uncharacterized protein n=1 Tax=Lactuca saligna TaxID=75948 RepID=A0AA35ZMW6_LACSI|nr:unnamed protein product [Lactuca saligna]